MSSVEQALGTSLLDQQNTIAAYAKVRGLKVAKFFVEAESGIREKQELRTQMVALQRDVREGDLVVCAKLDRWSRDTEHTLKTVREIHEKGASFYAVDDSCDPSTRDGTMMLTMRAMMATEEHARIKDRTVGTRKLLRNAGLYVEGLVPYGYRRTLATGEKGADKNVLLVEPEKAKVVRQVFALCIAGKSLNQVAAATGISKQQVYSALRQRAYTGQIKNSSGEWIKARHEPIIDIDTFTRARAALDKRRNGSAKPHSKESETSTWILRDVAKCPCGARMTSGMSGKPGTESRKYYYACSKKCVTTPGARWTGTYVPVRAIEEAASPVIAERLVALREELARPPAIASAAPKVVDTKTKRAKLAARRDRLIEMRADGAIDASTFKTKLAGVDEEVTKLDAEEIAVQRPSPAEDPKVRRAMLANVKHLLARWDGAAPSVRRQIVNALVLEVALVKDETPAPVWRDHADLAAEMTPGEFDAALAVARRR